MWPGKIKGGDFQGNYLLSEQFYDTVAKQSKYLSDVAGLLESSTCGSSIVSHCFKPSQDVSLLDYEPIRDVGSDSTDRNLDGTFEGHFDIHTGDGVGCDGCHLRWRHLFSRREVMVIDVEYLSSSLTTGTLILMSLPAIRLGADDAVEPLAAYGRDVGRGIQAQDDLIDLPSPSGGLGNQRPSDLVENKVTLVNNTRARGRRRWHSPVLK